MAEILSARALALIAQLDRALAKDGEDILLRRYFPAPSASFPNGIYFEVGVRARVSLYQPTMLVQGSGLAQGDSQVILSPSEINRTGWPGATNLGTPDKRIPVKDRCKLLIQGLERTVKAAHGIYIDNGLVKIVCTVTA